ncbi:unnamed protein product [Parnassius apollo]|uniref:(apollo) hypothetical protein n=1 Tax=Parnassius apollo TaxID=110799 RepID=A0A8S3WFA7_PARAO|nr:unnamed protein product [Parnassius apollo]
MAPRVNSVAWEHFTDKGQQMAECNICKIQLSFKSSVSNLTKHIKRKHPFVNLVRNNDVPAPVMTSQTNRQPPISDQSAGIVQQPEENRNSSQIQNEEQQLSDLEANPLPQPQINLVWQHYVEKMKNIQPKGTATSRAILDVQRYLDDKVVLPCENMSPL